MNLDSLRLSGLACAVVAAMGMNTAQAAAVSFTGQFSADDDVALFSFVIGIPSPVTLRTWSYAGGVNAAGTPIAEGGFDPMLTLFDDAGHLLAQQDDGGANVAASPVTGLDYDSFLSISLNPGTYILSLMQYNNHSVGQYLSDGFFSSGRPDFTSVYECSNRQFCDDLGNNRTSSWALDILTVDEATVVPAPPAIWLLGTAVAGLCSRRILRRQVAG